MDRNISVKERTSPGTASSHEEKMYEIELDNIPIQNDQELED